MDNPGPESRPDRTPASASEACNPNATPNIFANKPVNWGLESKPNVMRRLPSHHRSSSSSSSYDSGLETRVHRRAYSGSGILPSPLSSQGTRGGPPFFESTAKQSGFGSDSDVHPGHRRVTSLGNFYRPSSPHSVQNSQFAFMSNTAALYRNTTSHSPQSSIGSLDISTRQLSELGSPSFQAILTPDSTFSTGSSFVGSPQLPEYSTEFRPRTPPYTDGIVNGLGNINVQNGDGFGVLPPPPPPRQTGALQSYQPNGQSGYEDYDESSPKNCLWGDCSMVFENVNQLVEHVSSVHIGVFRLKSYSQSKKSSYYCGWKDCAREGKHFAKRHKLYQHLRTHTGTSLCFFI